MLVKSIMAHQSAPIKFLEIILNSFHSLTANSSNMSDHSPLKYWLPPLYRLIHHHGHAATAFWHGHRNLQSGVLCVSFSHLALYAEQSGHFRNIHTTKPFSRLKLLILPIAPRESAKPAPWPARQDTSCCLPTYLLSPLPSRSPLC